MSHEKDQPKKVVVGMSGGVDSSVVASILVGQGYQVIGVTLQTWKETGEVERPWLDRSCCKIGLARYVADRLKIPHQVVDIQQAFRDLVIKNFLQEYTSGRTPNPCVVCNEKVKFGLLLRIALDLGADYLATGHYARVGYHHNTGRYILRKGADRLKDQSYFLYRLSQEQLSRVMFPLGDLEKSQVWEMAEDLGLPAEEVAESQELCFVTQGDYRTLLQEEMPHASREGQIVDGEGRDLGQHHGVAFYTIGQRRGLGPLASGAGSGSRLYVTGLDPEQNRVVVGSETDLYQRRIIAGDLNLIRQASIEGGDLLVVTAKVRYRTAEAQAMVRRLVEDRLEIVFDQPQRAVTPGQSVVMYQGEDV
ncbi:MAG: tRNA 2-thiouridine(34) synthase MnmA, partial [Nitrospiria bacterium]